MSAARTLRAAVLTGGGGALIAAAALAQSGGGYDLRWHAQTAGGGTMSSANGYVLTGTVAQPDANAGAAVSVVGNYSLRSGFWSGVHESADAIFRSGFEPLVP